MKIGNIEFGPYPVFLAPMEDVTDIGFRLLCKKFGAAMVYSEFVAADALIRMVNRSLEKLKVCEDERPVAIQIYGKEVDPMVEAARIVVDQARPDVLDLNFGCPVKRVAGKGAGAGMLQNPDKMIEITKAVVRAVDIPVTVKTRLGWDEHSKIIVDLAERLQDCGIQALTIHGRTRAQMYTGEADWTLIGEVKKNPRMHIPLIGNGDITSPEKAKDYFERYGVDAVMVGRATFGRPWIFKEIVDYLCPQQLDAAANHIIESDYEVMSDDWKIDVLKEQVLTSVRRIDEYRGILHSRRHLAASPIFKGIPNFRETRIAMLRAETLDELFAILETAREQLRNQKG
ncbi:tRNA dihydrouridine synthase DusB [Bacteroides eggerthii]|uniref:tRNA-dihydrouridine synthase n=1 Tax=Bacteroides eggerthii TaxID=28111 RepID=A0ABT7U2D3_9BACE|nr:tRNA dihydrouridine synthase DusB [Bacteroides eggerthii]